MTYDGFRRDDGLFDIEAHLVDAKDHDYELLTGVRPAREAVHDMWVRVTIDREFVIHAIEARHRRHALSRRLRPHRPGVRRSWSAPTWSRAFASTCTTSWAACRAART